MSPILGSNDSSSIIDLESNSSSTQKESNSLKKETRVARYD